MRSCRATHGSSMSHARLSVCDFVLYARASTGHEHCGMRRSLLHESCGAKGAPWTYLAGPDRSALALESMMTILTQP